MIRIHKLPVFMAIIAAIIVEIEGIYNKKNFELIVYDIIIVIVITYVIGMIFKKALIRLAKDILQKRYTIKPQKCISEQQKTNQTKKNEIEQPIKEKT